ncbi:hypothetical protein ACP4OV_023839 [Aristida adscensionis]
MSHQLNKTSTRYPSMMSSVEHLLDRQSTLEMRSAGQSVVVCVNLFWTAAVAQCFLAALCHLRWGVFVLFAALIVVMSIFVILLLPETKQVPIEEIWMLFDKHWYWKRIVRKDPKYQGHLHQQQQQMAPANPAGVKPSSDV